MKTSQETIHCNKKVDRARDYVTRLFDGYTCFSFNMAHEGEKLNVTIALYYFSSLISNCFYLLLIRIYCSQANHSIDDTREKCMFSSCALALHKETCK
jgi:hypothetical protein